jgi:hypothetical protein
LIYFFPAWNKKAPYTRYNGEGHAGKFLHWVQKEAGVKFTYPIDVSGLGSPKTEDQMQKEREMVEMKQKEAEMAANGGKLTDE